MRTVDDAGDAEINPAFWEACRPCFIPASTSTIYKTSSKLKTHVTVHRASKTERLTYRFNEAEEGVVHAVAETQLA